MSAFVVEDEVINRILTKLNRQDYPKEIAGYKLDQTADLEALGHEMFALNVRAVDNRYAMGDAKNFRPLDYAFHFHSNGTKIGALKALCCWLYQCAEGDAYKSPLYDTMEEVKSAWAMDLVREMPEWDKAPDW